MSKLAKFLQFLPHILAGVVAVEQVLQSAPGATKKQLILNSIIAASQVGEKVPADIIAGVSTLIDSTVSTLNAAGVFGHAPAPPAA